MNSSICYVCPGTWVAAGVLLFVFISSVIQHFREPKSIDLADETRSPDEQDESAR